MLVKQQNNKKDGQGEPSNRLSLSSAQLKQQQQQQQQQQKEPLQQQQQQQQWRSVKFVSEAEEMNPMCRNTMEDSHRVIDGFGNDPTQGFFAVYDGHGGRGVVDHVASGLETNLLIELEHATSLSNLITATNNTIAAAAATTNFVSSGSSAKPNTVFHQNHERSVLECLISAFLITDIEAARKNLMVSGSTAACCLIRNEIQKGSENAVKVLYAANVGDTRAVLSRGGVAVRLTFDHKASDPNEVRRIELAGGFVMRKRVLGILSVTRSFGDHSMKKYILARPYTSRTEIRPDDDFLILACDGLWDVISDQEAVDLVRDFVSNSSGDKKKDLASMLVAESIARGSTDNVTAIVIEL